MCLCIACVYCMHCKYWDQNHHMPVLLLEAHLATWDRGLAHYGSIKRASFWARSLGTDWGSRLSLSLYLDISNSSVGSRPTEGFALCWADGSHLYMPYGIKAQVWFPTLSVACFRHKSVTSNVTVSVCIAICSDKGKANRVRKLRNISVLYARLGRVSSSRCLVI